MNVIDLALRMERDGRACYEKLAGEVPLSELRNLFTLLAAAEQRHHDMIAGMRDGEVSGHGESSLLEEARAIFRRLLELNEYHRPLPFDRDGYLLITRAEEQSITFYTEAARWEQDSRVRNLLLSLADEEREHLEVIENICDFIEAPRTFLEWREFGHRNGL